MVSCWGRQHQDSRDGQSRGRPADQMPEPPRRAGGGLPVVRDGCENAHRPSRSYDSPRETRMLLRPCASNSAASASPTPPLSAKISQLPGWLATEGSAAPVLRTLFGLPLELIEPVVEIFSCSAARCVSSPRYSKRSPRISTATRPASSRSRTSPVTASASRSCTWVSTPEMQAGTTVDPELIDAGRHEDALFAVFSRFSGNRSSETL